MNEIPTYPNECAHRREPDSCWECLTLQNCILESALHIEKTRVAELEVALRGTLTALGQIVDRSGPGKIELRSDAIDTGWKALGRDVHVKGEDRK